MTFLKNILGKTTRQVQLMAPVSGSVVRLSEVPDAVFAQKIVGDGIAINPNGDTIVSPCSGKISKIFKTNHAFSLLTDDGIELFVHFGIDTVALKGEGFERIASEGYSVGVGDVIIKYDLEYLTREAKSVFTPMIISNMDKVISMESAQEKQLVEAGKDVVITLKLQK